MIILTSGKPSCSPHHCHTIRTAGGTQIYVEVQLSVFRGSLLIGEHKEIVLTDSNVFNDWRGDGVTPGQSLLPASFPQTMKAGIAPDWHPTLLSDFRLLIRKIGRKTIKMARLKTRSYTLLSHLFIDKNKRISFLIKVLFGSICPVLSWRLIVSRCMKFILKGTRF